MMGDNVLNKILALYQNTRLTVEKFHYVVGGEGKGKKKKVRKKIESGVINFSSLPPDCGTKQRLARR